MSSFLVPHWARPETYGGDSSFIDWLMDSPILKPISDALRDDRTKEAARALVPGFVGGETIAGGISGLGALIGSSLDRGPGGVSELDQDELVEILKGEAAEGIHAGLEQVAPIDIAAMGFPLAGRIAGATKLGKGLSAAGDIADIAEAGYGGTQVASGLGKGDLAEAGVGLARMAGGSAAVLPRMRGIDAPEVPMDIEGRVPFDPIPEVLPQAAMPKNLEDVPSRDLFAGEVVERRLENMAEDAFEKIKVQAAETLQNPRILDAKLEISTVSDYDPDTNVMRIAVDDLEADPSVIAHEFGHTGDFHEFGGQSPEGPFITLQKGDVAEISPDIQPHYEENIPLRAATGNPQEHLFQTTMDAVKNQPEVAEVISQLRRNIGDIDITDDIPLTVKPEYEHMYSLGRGSVEPRLPSEEVNSIVEKPIKTRVGDEEWTIKPTGKSRQTTQNDEIYAEVIMIPPEGTPHIKWMPKSSLELRIEESNAIPTIATEGQKLPKSSKTRLEEINRVLEDPEATPKMKQRALDAKKIVDANVAAKQRTPGEVEETPKRKNEKTFEVHLSDGTSRKQRALTADAARRRVEEGQKAADTGLEVMSVDVKQRKPKAPKAKLTQEEITAIGEVLGEKPGEAPEIAEARAAVLEAISGKTREIEPTPKERRIRDEIVETDRRIAESDERLKEIPERPKTTVEEEIEAVQGGRGEPPSRKPPKGDDGSGEGPKDSDENVEALKKGFWDDITDIPKTLKFSFDISWPGRQGLFLLNRPEALKGMVEGSSTAIPYKGRQLHEKIKAELAERPNAELYEKSGLNQYKYDPTEVTDISQRAEEIPSERAAKLPGIRHSTRAFEDAANLARANVFDTFVKKFEAEGKTFETHPELYQGMAEYLNVLTMRKPLPAKLRSAGWILNKLFISPMAVYSRLSMMNPLWYKRLPREMQKAALRDIGGTVAVLGMALGATKIAAVQAGHDEDEVDVIADPTHTDFGKLKVGDTYYDMFSGMIQPVRTAARILSGTRRIRGEEERSRVKGGVGDWLGVGEALDLDEGSTAKEEIDRFFEYKKSPLYQAWKGLSTKENFYGDEYGLTDLFTDLLMPLSIEEPVEAYQYYDEKEAAKQLPGVLGVGTQIEFPDEDEDFGGGGLEYPF